jgi:hypothetical protein
MTLELVKRKVSAHETRERTRKIFRNKRQAVKAAGLSRFELIAPFSFALFERFVG